MVVITQTLGFCRFLPCNYIFLLEAIGYAHINIALGWSVFLERNRGSGIIKVVEMSENDWSDFGLTQLYFRLIVMWLGMGIRIVWVQKEPWDGQKCLVYCREATAIFSHLNFYSRGRSPFESFGAVHLSPHCSFELPWQLVHTACSYSLKSRYGANIIIGSIIKQERWLLPCISVSLSGIRSAHTYFRLWTATSL